METDLITDVKITREKLFIELYKSVFPHAAQYISKMGGNLDDAKDVFQEAVVLFNEKTMIEGYTALQTQLFHIIGKHCGHSWQEVEEHFIRDRYMNAMEARSFGLIDEVLGDAGDLILLKRTVPEVIFSRQEQT